MSQPISTGFASTFIQQATGLQALKNGVYVKTLSGALTLDGTIGNIAVFDGGAADRTLTFDTTAIANGVVRVIVNKGSTNSLIVKDSAAVTCLTLAHGDVGFFYHDGIGLRGFQIAAAGVTISS